MAAQHLLLLLQLMLLQLLLQLFLQLLVEAEMVRSEVIVVMANCCSTVRVRNVHRVLLLRG